MCLYDLVSVDIERKETFKIFGIHREGYLTSAFDSGFQYDLRYKSGEEIEHIARKTYFISKHSPGFYSFESFKDAVEVSLDNHWDFVTGKEYNYGIFKLVVLPVTIKRVIYQGNLEKNVYGDSKKYPGFISKKILVHDSELNRKLYQESCE